MRASLIQENLTVRPKNRHQTLNKRLMSSRIFSTFILILLVIQVGQSQKLTEFSTNKLEFYQQLEDYMTASKKKSMEEVVENFGGQFQAGFSAEQQDTIIATCNRMLKLKMSASTYFKNYFIGLTPVSYTHLTLPTILLV